MTINFDEYYPFESGPGSASSEDRWGIMARFWRDSGVVRVRELSDLSITNELDVFADGSGMNVKVRDGIVTIQGFTGRINTQKTLPIPAANGSNPRIDLVVARLDRSSKVIGLDVVAGTPASSPVAPSPSHNSANWDVVLAEVYVGAGVSSIVTNVVTDTREFSENNRLVREAVTSSTVAIPNTAYSAENDDTQISFNLPPYAEAKDEFIVFANGDAGFMLLSNSGANSQVIYNGNTFSQVSEANEVTLYKTEVKGSMIHLECVKGGDDQVWFARSLFGGAIDSGGNYFGDGSDGHAVITTNTNLAASQDGDMVVRQYESLTISNGAILTTAERCKGLLIFVKGDCMVNDGAIEMTARGAYVDPIAAGVSPTGIRIPMLKTGSAETLGGADFSGCGAAAIAAMAYQPGINSDGKIYTIERTGANGAAAQVSDNQPGVTGGSGTGKTGGGGSGGVSQYGQESGAGAAGTCFSGGSGGGGAGRMNINAHDGATNGGPGGDGAASTSDGCGAGGAGNGGGKGRATASNSVYPNANGGDGTGGVIILIVGGLLTVGPSGAIRANGVRGGDSDYSQEYGKDSGYTGLGGGSGGGICLLLHSGEYSSTGTVEAAGGTGGTDDGFNGGNGGSGWVCVEKVD